MMSSVGNAWIVRGDILKDVFDEMDIIGSACTQLLIEVIESKGIILDEEDWYKLSELERALMKTFGEDATPLLVERIGKCIRLIQNDSCCKAVSGDRLPEK